MRIDYVFHVGHAAVSYFNQGFESRWMSVELICYVMIFTTYFVRNILWWTDRLIIVDSNLYNTTIFETWIGWFLRIEIIYSPELTTFGIVFLYLNNVLFTIW